MCEIAPSMLAADFMKLGEQLDEVKKSGVTWLHVDVMDGIFVPSISFGMPVIASIRKKSDLFFDVHLMIKEPVRYLKEFVEAGADSITIHAEACEDIRETLQELKKYPVKRAIAINPGTSIDPLMPYLADVDMILIMSVEPGFGGQKLIPETLQKIKDLIKIREEKEYHYLLEIDGGVNIETMSSVIESGVDVVVAGTAVFRGDIKENVRHLKEVGASAS